MNNKKKLHFIKDDFFFNLIAYNISHYNIFEKDG